MISYLKGKVIYKGRDHLIVDANNIGFSVFLSEKDLEKAPEPGEEIELFCVLYIKKETLELYGLLTQEKLETFKILDKISGIGPKIALALCSIGSLEEIKKAVESQDKKFLKQTRGIGGKKRQMIILDLTGKITQLKPKASKIEDEAVEALINLGFSRQNVKMVLEKLPKDIEDQEQRVKQALRLLGKTK